MISFPHHIFISLHARTLHLVDLNLLKTIFCAEIFGILIDNDGANDINPQYFRTLICFAKKCFQFVITRSSLTHF